MSQAVTPQSEDFSKWYNEIVYRADLAAQSPVRGSVIIKPYGYEIADGYLPVRTHPLVYLPRHQGRGADRRAR